jgi:hypothetical protein
MLIYQQHDWVAFMQAMTLARRWGVVVGDVEDPVERIAFPLEEYEALTSSGTASVSGRACQQTRAGSIKTAADEEILLTPITTYSNQWKDVSLVGRLPLAEPDPRLEAYIRRTTADADGRFIFRDVPPGEYFLVAPAICDFEGRPDKGNVVEELFVKNGQRLELIVRK